MARYKIGEIVASTGISPHALKYYEKEGLLHPQTDADSGYRYYDEKDLGAVMQIHRYRQWGFSTKEISAIQEGVSEEELPGLFAARIAANEAEIRRLQEADRLMEQHVSGIRRCFARRGTWEVAQMPTLHYLPHYVITGGETAVPPLDPVAQQMGDNLGAFNTVRVTLEGPERAPRQAVWGLLRFAYPGESFSARWRERGITVPGGSFLIDYRQGRRGEHFDPASLAGTLATTRREGLTVTGDAYCVFLNMVDREGTREALSAFLLPVKK